MSNFFRKKLHCFHDHVEYCYLTGFVPADPKAEMGIRLNIIYLGSQHLSFEGKTEDECVEKANIFLDEQDERLGRKTQPLTIPNEL